MSSVEVKYFTVSGVDLKISYEILVLKGIIHISSNPLARKAFCRETARSQTESKQENSSVVHRFCVLFVNT